MDRNKLVEDHFWCAERFTHAFFWRQTPEVSKEDIYQECCLCLVEAASTFDGSRCSFTTFLWTCLNNLRMMHNRRVTRRPKLYAVDSIEEYVTEKSFLQPDELSRMLKMAHKAASLVPNKANNPKVAERINALLSGKSERQIAEEEGVSVQAVNLTTNKFKRELAILVEQERASI